MNAPCRDCANRGCGSYHDHCPAYQKFNEERKNILAQNRTNKGINSAIGTNIQRMKHVKNDHKVIKSHKK